MSSSRTGGKYSVLLMIIMKWEYIDWRHHYVCTVSSNRQLLTDVIVVGLSNIVIIVMYRITIVCAAQTNNIYLYRYVTKTALHYHRLPPRRQNHRTLLSDATSLRRVFPISVYRHAGDRLYSAASQPLPWQPSHSRCCSESPRLRLVIGVMLVTGHPTRCHGSCCHGRMSWTGGAPMQTCSARGR